MLGRKQSLKGDMILADYGPEESLNENADIEWVNKVCGWISWSMFTFGSRIHLMFVLAMGSTDNANVCTALIGLRVIEYTKNV